MHATTPTPTSAPSTPSRHAANENAPRINENAPQTVDAGSRAASRGRGLNRRQFLQSTAASAAALALGGLVPRVWAAPASEPDFSFFVISDTHLTAEKSDPQTMVPLNARVNARMVKVLNELPGQTLPESMGGGKVIKPKAVLHLGDIVNDGDKTGAVYEQMVKTEWKQFVEDYGLTGSDGQLHYPMYETPGNHDSPHDTVFMLDAIRERNKHRPGLTAVSDSGLFYSWDWGGVHFITLGVTVGQNEKGLQVGRYNSHGSLQFLIKDLKEHVGDSGKPVITMHHVDVVRYSKPCSPTVPPAPTNDEWSGCDVHAYYEAIKPYNVVAIFHGHLHAQTFNRWDGTNHSVKTGGIPIFGVDNAGDPGGRGIFYCTVEDGQLVVRAYHSDGVEGWSPTEAKLHWTDIWRTPLKARA